LEKKHFICSECGAEYYLQAWKAVCPSCKSEYTLTLVEEVHEARKILTAREYASLLLVIYGVYGLAFPGSTVVSYLAGVVPQAQVIIYSIPLLVALFLYLGTDGGVAAAVVLGVASLIHGLATLPSSGLSSAVSSTIAAIWIVGAVHFYRYMSRKRRHHEKIEDARELPEYTGWGKE